MCDKNIGDYNFFKNPVCHADIIEEGIFKTIRYWKNYQIYSNC